MTFQPPPPPPPAGPPPPGGPPPGAWGPPPGAPPPSRGFDPKSVNQLDWGILGAGVLAFIFSFVSYYSYSGGGTTVSDSAWHGFFGWFAMLLALVGSGLIAMVLFAPQIKLPVPARLAGLGCYAVATLCVILAIFIVPSSVCYEGVCGTVPSSVDKGHSFGFWISLIVIIAGLVLSLMRFQQTGGELPGALAKVPNIGGQHPGGPAGPPPQGPPPGYGPPPGPPQGPPPG